MTDALLGVFGPLAKPECVRASRRDWLIWLRLIPALGAGLVVFAITWTWATLRDFEPTHLPYSELRVGLNIIAAALVALAGLIPPAVLAGSLAGEKERGSIALLLSTQASAGDIVLGRWVGRLAPVALVGASAVPGLLWLAFLAGFDGRVALGLVGLPAAVALGSGGFALGVSAVSRRGRDALLLIYLVDVILMLGPVVAAIASSTPTAGASAGSWGPEWLELIGPGMFDPLSPVVELIWSEDAAPAVVTGLAWLVLGGLGLAAASWRLRPSCLNDGSGTRRRGRQARRAWEHRVPPVGTRPMLWKELHVERAGSMGRVGRWLGGLLVLWLGLGSLILGGLVLRGDPGGSEPWAVATLARWYAGPATLISFLIQWAIGLRAGVAIASERERGTWDGLLTSPLGGAEIVLGKLSGSLHALRWLIGAALLAWTVSWAAAAMTGRQYGSVLAETACCGTLMAAAGVALSLRSATATKAMGATLACWLGMYLGLKALAAFACFLTVAACALVWLTATQMGLTAAPSPWFPMPFRLGMELVFCSAAALIAFLFVADTRVRFDRLAGRMTAGDAAVRLDELIHGRPMAPVRLGGKPEKPLNAGYLE